MKILLLIIFAVGVLLYVFWGLRQRLQPEAAPAKDCQGGDTCGVSCFCDDSALKRQMSEEIIYFEDEELDQFRGVEADAYSESDIEAFAEVLTTLQPQEVADWLHSLQLRGINLPEALKEETAIMMQ